MKTLAILLFVFCYAECRKIVPIDKNANLAFINMEGGGGVRPTPPAAPVKQATPVVVTTQKVPVTTPKVVVTAPAVVTTTPISQITPKKVNPPVVVNPITTPGPGSVKQLVNFYDSQGRASPIRPYSYSQAVKQG